MSTLNILYDYLCWSQIKLFMQVEVTWEKVEIFTSFTHIIFHFRDLKEKNINNAYMVQTYHPTRNYFTIHYERGCTFYYL